MSTIVDRCTELSARLVALQRLESLRGQAEQIEQRRGELATTRERLAVAEAQTAVLVASGDLTPAVWPSGGSALAALGKVRGTMQADAARIASGRDYRDLLTRVDKASETMELAVKAAWALVLAAADPVDARMLAQLAQVPGQHDAAQRVRELRMALGALGAHPPPSMAHHEAFHAAAAQLLKAWQALDHGDIPETVMRFFKEAQTPSGAPDGLWTAEVRAWLVAHGMLANVRIVFRAGR